MVSAAAARGRSLRAGAGGSAAQGTDSSGASELGSELDADADALSDDEVVAAAGAGGAPLKKGAHEHSASNLPAPAVWLERFEYTPVNAGFWSLESSNFTLRAL